MAVDETLDALLLRAVRLGQVEKALQLIEAGADVNAREPRCDEPRQGSRTNYSLRPVLVHAAESHTAEAMVPRLIEAGADVNATDARGRSPLLVAMAMAMGHFQAVRHLIAAGADVQARSQNGQTLGAGAAVNADPEMLQLALDTGFDPSKTSGSETLLVKLVRRGGIYWDSSEKLECVRMLLATGADVNAPDKNGDPIAVLATKHANVQVLRALLQAGASVDARDEQGMTASMWAAGHRSDFLLAVTTLNTLFEFGARVDVTDVQGRPLLFYAVGGCDESGSMCRTVLEAGGDVESRDPEGRSALMIAAEKGRVEATRILLAAGDNVEGRDEKGWTPLMHAAYIPQRATHAANTPSPQWSAYWNSENQSVADNYQRLRQGKREIARWLLEAGAQRNVRAGDGTSVLFIAASDPVDGVLEVLR